MKSYVEHANMSVVDAQKTINFLTSARLCCLIQFKSERQLNRSYFKQYTEFRAYLSQLAC